MSGSARGFRVTNGAVPGHGPIAEEHVLLFIISVDRAALVLGLEPRQTRDLCRQGVLDAKLLGREWAVSLPSVLTEKRRRDEAAVRRVRSRGRR